MMAPRVQLRCKRKPGSRVQRRGRPAGSVAGPTLDAVPFRCPAAPALADRTDDPAVLQHPRELARQDLEVAPKVDSPTQLAQQIRFGLNTLGENNAHHDFERLCHGLVRRRITSNLIPATGPVSSGGDQGRDSESHWTNLPDELPGTSTFIALASGEKVVLACTVQREDVPTKIRHDLASITGQGDPVHRVTYFTVVGVPVGKRHELQDETLRNHDVALEIWDATAIADHLSDPDLFFLAVDYLHLPSSLAPKRPADDPPLPGWYLADRERWRSRSLLTGTLGELVDLREPLRHASYHVEARADLPDWLVQARALLAAATSTDVVVRAQYAIVTATVHGYDTLRPADDVLCDFFATAISEVSDPGLLQDAVILLEFCFAAILRRATSVTPAELDGWRRELSDKIDCLLAAGPYPNAEAHLLSLQARLAFHQRLPEDTWPDPAELPSFTDATARVLAAVEAGTPIRVELGGVQLIDVDKGMAALARLGQSLQRAPLFPVEQTATHFDMLAPLLVDHPLYAQVRDALDAATDRINGQAAKGDRAQTRAIQLLNADRLLDALNEIHEAKVNWWQGDTITGGLIMMLLAARVYSRLGLPIAAKQYALAAAAAANSASDPDLSVIVARGLILAATYDHQAGSWLTATYTFRAGIFAQSALTDDPWSFDRYPYLLDMVIDQAHILRAARTVRPEYLPCIQAAVTSTGVDRMLEPMLQRVAELPPLAEDEYATIADRDGIGRPFSDAGPTRRYTWAALDMQWTVTAANDRRSVLAAERFVAAAQIVLAELAIHDAMLLGGEITVDVRPDAVAGTGGADGLEEVTGAPGGHWVVHLTGIDTMNVDTVQVEVTSALVYILLTNSLLPREQFMAVIECAFEKGLWHKLVAGRPYDEIADLLRQDVYAQFAALDRPPPGARMPVRQRVKAEAMRPRRGLAPGYDREQSLQAVQARYENLLPPVRYTLSRIAQDPGFRAVAGRLRVEGWRDWHLLTAITDLVANKRAAARGLRVTTGMTPADQQRFVAIAFEPEQAEDPQLAPEVFTEEDLQFHLQVAVLSTIKMLGLQVHQRRPDYRALFALLGERYNYWTDDVEHEDFFDWNS